MVQTSKYLLIDAPAVTSGQGRGKIIQYVTPDLYILCPKHVRSKTDLTWEAKVVAAADAVDTAETNWKHKDPQTEVT